MQIFSKGIYSGATENIVEKDGIIATITAYNKTAFNNTLHFHDNMHISLVITGGCIERKKESYERVPGKLTFYHAGEKHEVKEVIRQSKHINLEIEKQFFEQNDVTESLLYTMVTKGLGANFLMIKAYKEMIAPDYNTIATIQMLLLSMFLTAKKMHYEKRPPKWLSIIHDFINDNWNERFTLTDLSNAASVHPITISKYFPKYFACTLGEYMRKLKIEKSIYLINSNRTSLTDIAYSCGFADQSHFTRAFREIMGYTPRQYQKLSLS